MELDEKTIQRFWSKVNVKDVDECWEWLASGLGSGYGLFKIGRKKYLSHRISWIIYNGIIPNGLYILHKCDNPKCVNPNHLFLGTQKDNVTDMIKKGRHRFTTGNRTYDTLAISIQTFNSVLTMLEKKLTHKVIAKELGISTYPIHLIKNNKHHYQRQEMINEETNNG